MAYRTHVSHDPGHALPDLPAGQFADEDALYDRGRGTRQPARRTAPAAQPSRSQSPRPSSGQLRNVPERTPTRNADRVTSVRMRPEVQAAIHTQPRASSHAWHWSPPVMPQPAQVFDLALPNLVTAASTALVTALGTFSPMGLPVWAIVLFVPIMLLALFAGGVRHLGWKRAALINIATLALLFPSLIVRQSVVRIPFVDAGNGTLLAPSIATITVLVVLLALAMASAALAQEDPESSGMLFLPAAMMVPLMAGQTDILGLRTALLMVCAIFLISAGLTVLASVLPGSFPTLVAPLAIALEFVVLALMHDTSVFPTGAGTSAKVLFFVIVLATAGLASVIPSISGWIRQVTRLTERRAIA